MALSPGTSIGHYDVSALIGEGGMGQVWQATDTQLNRQVALKILPDAFADDPDRLARFTREAQILASLNHPNIAAIHGIEEAEGTRALVLELVEGPTLADRISQGPIPLDEALPIAKQIAEALEAAHEAGVIHRDLKPANIKVREDGTVKVLDFGLAKALDPAPASDPDQSPTLTAAATQMGVILGTTAYMSPEQARGKPVDKRADIWAFGAVLFEMLTGRPLFERGDVSEVLASLVLKEPDLTAVADDTPPAMRTVLRRCLVKDPKRRLRDIGEARLLLETDADQSEVSLWTGPRSSDTAAGDRSTDSGWRWTALVAGVVVGVMVTAGAFWWMTAGDSASSARVTRYIIHAPEGYSIDSSSGLAISPDGNRLVYSATDARGFQYLFLRDREQVESVRLDGTEGGYQPSFSPDGEWVAFRSLGNEHRILSLAGGSATSVASDSAAAGFAWGPDGRMVYRHSRPAGLRGVSEPGAEPVWLTEPANGEVHLWPEFLPDGSGLLFTINSGSSIEEKQVALLTLDTGQIDRVVPGTTPKVSPTGHLLFGRTDSIWAAPFSLEERALSGAAVPVVDGVQVNLPGGWTHYSLGLDGTLAYMPMTDAVGPNRLVWVDRHGRIEPLQGIEADLYHDVALSPDGSRLAMGRGFVREAGELWTYDVARQTSTRLVVDARNPVWSRDGQDLIYYSTVSGQEGLYRQRWDGSGAAELLYRGDGRPLYPVGWTDGGALVVDALSENQGLDINLLALDAEPSLTPLIATEFNEHGPSFSPDGRWLAYTSDHTGVQQVYVQPFPGLDRRIPVSTDGGREPRWSPSGGELFHSSLRGEILAVSIETGPTVTVGEPVSLGILSSNLLQDRAEANTNSYDLDASGERVVVIARGSAGATGSGHIVVVDNWFTELNRLVPID